MEAMIELWTSWKSMDRTPTGFKQHRNTNCFQDEPVCREWKKHSNGNKKKRGRESPKPVKKDVAPSTREKKSSLESLNNNTINLSNIEYNSEEPTSKKIKFTSAN
ncbi:hypothetical protein TNCV_4474961 [Trichonephila clavipes]|nr:hypothetical protein TNCV_4474961 [Trichonephila clavipes]